MMNYLKKRLRRVSIETCFKRLNFEIVQEISNLISILVQFRENKNKQIRGSISQLTCFFF